MWGWVKRGTSVPFFFCVVSYWFYSSFFDCFYVILVL
jgi:hypothetical protein